MIQRVGSSAKPRKWMSVHEMGDMLGLKKTDRYWLVHKNYFRTETLLGKMRVEIASFEKWYANQDWYHKVNGEAPGKELRLRSYSPKEIQEMLGTDNATVYEILKKNNIETVTVNERMRVPTMPSGTGITASPDTVHRKIVRKMQLQRQPVSVCRKWPGCLTFHEVPYMES